ncbi:hypothetical protein YUYDRAFT_03072 [Streptomyces sp. ScaeMP-e48]|nr:hypothetical protein YUYDRAFT_03072 [Streptomyces sp. ScaeMP-e48]
MPAGPPRPRTPEPSATPTPTSRLPAPCAMPYVPAPTSGAVSAAETGMRPEKRVARSAPMRCRPMYQQTKPITVTTTACQRRAVVSAGVGTRRNAAPSITRPSSADCTAAMAQTVAASSFGPSGRSTGTARTAKPTSPASAPADQKMPARSVRPQPWTVNAPAATSPAAYKVTREGRRLASMGARTPTTMGAQPTKTPGTAGSAVRSAARTARLKPTIPTAASRPSRIHRRQESARSGAATGTGPRRSTAASSRAARPYRSAWPPAYG